MNQPPAAPRRWPRLVTAVALAAAFGLVIIGAGGGAGPIGLLLILGEPAAWGYPQALGLAGLVLSLTAPFLRHERINLRLSRLGLVLLSGSWLLFFHETQVPAATLLTSAPFGLLLVLRLAQTRRPRHATTT